MIETHHNASDVTCSETAETATPATCLGYDVLVLGGGPAGASAAISAARLGLSTMLVRTHLKAPPAPVEVVPPSFADALARLGVRPTGLCQPGRIIARYAETITGWHVERSALEAALLRTAIRTGAVVRRDEPRALLTEDGRVLGARLAGGDLVRSKVLIDATGTAGWLRRRLDLRRVALSDPMIAARGQVRGRLRMLGGDGMSFIPNASGWTFMIAHDGLISWMCLCTDGRRPERPSVLASATECIPTTHASVGWQLMRPLAGHGWLIAGEAAGRVDPAGGCGLADALAGGARAAHAAALSIGDPDAAKAAQSTYDGWYAGLIVERASELIRRYAAHGIRLDRHQMRSNAA